MGKKKLTIGILAHVDAGKTTLSEAMLYLTGEIRKAGRVDHGDAYLDDNFIERDRGITIFSKQVRFTAGRDGDTEVTLIDTPGHADFTAETERVLPVLDYALLVVSGSEGIQSHTRTLYRMLRERSIPVFVFVNKMDISLRSRAELIDELRSGLGAGAVDFTDAGARSDGFIDAVTLYSAELAETALEGDGEISDKEIAKAIKTGEVVPCMFGSALRIEGVSELLDAISAFTEQPSFGTEFGARIYKIAEAEDGEKLSFLKITGGDLRVRDKVTLRCASGGQREEKISRIRLYSGSRFIQTEAAGPGTVCAVTGLGQVRPGDSLGDELPSPKSSAMPYMVYTVTGPEDVDPHRLKSDLDILTTEDPALQTGWAADGRIEMRLMGRVQLEVLQSLIKERFGYDVSFGSGSVLYKETIRGRYEGVGHFEPLRHYAEVHLMIEQGERDSGIVITSEVPEDDLSLNWQRLIITHIDEKEHLGVLTGSPLTDVKISLVAGRAHAKHTEGGDFREATYRAVRNALMQALRDGNAVLLEPWSSYEADIPAECVGRAMMDIKQMGGTQDGLEQSEGRAVIRGRVPSAEIADYQQILAGYTSGEGRLSLMRYGYDVCHNADDVIAESGYDPERDIANTADSVFVNHSGSDIVKWDEVKDHMHIKSVLKGREESPDSGIDDGIDVRERAKRRAAAENELRAIFERTYGAPKQRTHSGRTERNFSEKPELSREEAERNAARNAEIKAKHERRAEAPAELETLILIDGYNLIFSDRYLKELAEEDIGSARDQLIDRLKNYAGYTGFEVTVVFDAYKVVPGAGSSEDHSGVKVIYTAQDEPADILIGKMINSVKDRRIYAVSSDELVQRDAWTHGALRLSSREFMELLDSTDEEVRSLLARS